MSRRPPRACLSNFKYLFKHWIVRYETTIQVCFKCSMFCYRHRVPPTSVLLSWSKNKIQMAVEAERPVCCYTIFNAPAKWCGIVMGASKLRLWIDERRDLVQFIPVHTLFRNDGLTQKVRAFITGIFFTPTWNSNAKSLDILKDKLNALSFIRNYDDRCCMRELDFINLQWWTIMAQEQ